MLITELKKVGLVLLVLSTYTNIATAAPTKVKVSYPSPVTVDRGDYICKDVFALGQHQWDSTVYETGNARHFKLWMAATTWAKHVNGLYKDNSTGVTQILPCFKRSFTADKLSVEFSLRRLSTPAAREYVVVSGQMTVYNSQAQGKLVREHFQYNSGKEPNCGRSRHDVSVNGISNTQYLYSGHHYINGPAGCKPSGFTRINIGDIVSKIPITRRP